MRSQEPNPVGDTGGASNSVPLLEPIFSYMVRGEDAAESEGGALSDSRWSEGWALCYAHPAGGKGE